MWVSPRTWRAAKTAGRDPGAIGMEGRVSWNPIDPDRFARQVERWRDAGATHLSIDTMYAGQRGVDDHIRALHDASSLIGLR